MPQAGRPPAHAAVERRRAGRILHPLVARRPPGEIAGGARGRPPPPGGVERRDRGRWHEALLSEAWRPGPSRTCHEHPQTRRRWPPAAWKASASLRRRTRTAASATAGRTRMATAAAWGAGVSHDSSCIPRRSVLGREERSRSTCAWPLRSAGHCSCHAGDGHPPAGERYSGSSPAGGRRPADEPALTV